MKAELILYCLGIAFILVSCLTTNVEINKINVLNTSLTHMHDYTNKNYLNLKFSEI